MAAYITMIRRFFCIVLVLAARLGTLVGRASAEEPNAQAAIPLPTLGGKQFWSDQLHFHQWRIQRNVFTGDCRLLDGKNRRHASGTFEQCKDVLDRIRRQKNLPPMKGRAVLVLHGLMRSHSAMEGLCKHLRKGGYTVFNIEYPSTQADVAAHAQSLRSVIDNLHGIEEINFVGHSMGNIVVRHYLGDLAREDITKQKPNATAADRRAKMRFHRFVMIGPPNQGAKLATTFADNALFKGITGEAGQQLGQNWTELEKRLATPDFQFGIVAGGRGDGKGYNPMLSGDNDAVVSVEAAKLSGAHDFIVVPVLHSFLMDNAKVKKYVLQFIRNGYFISEKKRHPLEKPHE